MEWQLILFIAKRCEKNAHLLFSRKKKKWHKSRKVFPSEEKKEEVLYFDEERISMIYGECQM
jgi:hypothetical protein